VGAPRLYRTGDLVRQAAGGEIEFLGRIDTQVKIRGFRVELGEIESALIECPGVRGAAVALREDQPGVQQLVGYVVPRDGVAELDLEAIWPGLRARLPGYMVPAMLEVLAELPTMPSGKVDRKRLPVPSGRAVETKGKGRPPHTELETAFADVWGRLFAPLPVSVEDDFFLDLGGHSLVAARMVSELRKDPRLAGLSMLDVYEHPTIEGLAAKYEKQAGAGAPDGRAGAPEFVQPSSVKHFFCGLAQFISLYVVLGLFALQWLAPYLTYTWLIDDEYETSQAILGALGILVGLYPVMLLLAIAAKWIIIGRYKPGGVSVVGDVLFPVVAGERDRGHGAGGLSRGDAAVEPLLPADGGEGRAERPSRQ